jgi:diguanylate cyclase (GGDEF)-like protein
MPALDEAVASDSAAILTQRLEANERIWFAFHRLELALIGSQSLPELLAAVCHELPAAFAQVDCAGIVGFDPGHEFTQLHEKAAVAALPAHAFAPAPRSQFQRVIASAPKPWLGPCDRALQSLLFPGFPAALACVALSPLRVRGQVIGLLAQGSRTPGHYSPDHATDLLEHLAAVVALCLDNITVHERLKTAGLTDALTGVANRRCFEGRLEEEVARALRRQEPLACLLVDVDHFKRINDQFGHPEGDRVLRLIAGLLEEGRRTSDVLARYGGEEFVLLMANTAAEPARQVAERLRSRVADTAVVLGNKQRVHASASFGIAVLSRYRSTNGLAQARRIGAQLVAAADGALYAAKAGGRNRVELAAWAGD